MKITPLDIKKQEFRKAVRGYDVDEVDTFLEMLSNELESLIRERNELGDEVLKLKTQLGDYQGVEKTLKETLMTAQQSVNESREVSSREAEIVMREAELKAEKLMEETKLKLATMKNELVLIKAQKDSFSRRLRHLLESQIELIQVLEMDDLGFSPVRSTSSATQKRKSDYSQEKIEFEGVDDLLPEEDRREQSVSQSAQQEQVRRVDNVNSEEDRDDEGKRISDQLIV